MAFYIYILDCKGNRYYTGYTTDLARRYQEHQDGSSKSKFTRAFPPKKIVACWEVKSKSLAMKVEQRIKQLTRKKKEALIDRPESIELVAHPVSEQHSGCITLYAWHDMTE